MDIFKLGDKILALLETVFGFWNNQISLIFDLLGQSPDAFKGGGPWKVIAGIEPIFVAVGSSLVVLFFVIGFCSESIDIREEMRFEVILRILIRLGLAEYMVANNVTIMKAFFSVLAGHNGSRRGTFFTNLSSAKAGTEVKLTTKEGVTHCYTVEEMRVVSPYDAWVTEESDTEVLTLFTCAEHGTRRFACRCVPVGDYGSERGDVDSE